MSVNPYRPGGKPDPLRRWQARWRDANGVQQAKVLPNKTLAQEYERERMVEANDPTTIVTAKNATMADALARWEAFQAAQLQRGKTNARSINMQRARIERHVLSTFAPERRLSMIRETDVLAWWAALGEAGASSNSVRTYYACLRQVLHVATLRGLDGSPPLVLLNPCNTNTNPPPGENKEHPAPTWAEAEKIVACLDGERDQMIGRVLISSGLRIGEVLALTDEAVSFDGQLTEFSLSVIVRCEDDGSGVQLRPGTKHRPKGRMAWIPPNQLDASEQLASYMLATPRGAQGLIFPNDSGGIRRTAAFDQAFKRALRKAGLEDRGFTVHDLRATAGLRFTDDYDPFVAQQLLGHKHITTTEQYLRIAPEAVRDLLRQTPSAAVSAPARGPSRVVRTRRPGR